MSLGCVESECNLLFTGGRPLEQSQWLNNHIVLAAIFDMACAIDTDLQDDLLLCDRVSFDVVIANQVTFVSKPIILAMQYLLDLAFIDNTIYVIVQ